MVFPVITLVIIPIFLGIVYVAPFDQPQEIQKDIISEEPDVSILYFILIGIWTILLLRMLIRIRKGTFKLTQRY